MTHLPPLNQSTIDDNNKILFASSECTPLIKTGGLADVCGSLPQALKSMGEDVRIALPGYQAVLEQIPAPEYVGLLVLPLGTVTVCHTQQDGLDIILINHELFSNRAGNPYMADDNRPWPDNARRFALFSQAVCAIAKNQASFNWQPDVVHCHDWQTGLVPAMLAAESSEKIINRPPTLFTIHNLAYQGNIGMHEYNELKLPKKFLTPDGLEFWGQASFIKAGIAYADRLNTVSEKYATEITTAAFGCGMEGILHHRRDKLSGILNGIDTDIWNPATDTHITKNYSARTLDDKLENKKHLQSLLGLTCDPNTILFGVVSRLAAQKGIDLITKAVTKSKADNFQLAVLGSGETKLQKQLVALQKRYPKNISITFGLNEALSHKIEAGADVFLMPSRYEPCGLNQMYSHRYGTLPLVTAVGGLADTVVGYRSESGTPSANGFSIDSADSESLYTAMQTAIALYANKSLWREMQNNAMQVDYSWTKSAMEYRTLYNKMKVATANQKP